MLTFLDFFISSFAQLLSSPSFTTMANKSVLSAVDHYGSPSPSGSQDNVHSALAGGTDERHTRHIELESSLRASLLKSSSPKLPHSPSNPRSGFVSTPTVPANSPSVSPSDSFPGTFEDAFAVASADFSGAHSACPSFGPSVSSTPTFDLSLISDCSDSLDENPEDFHPFDSTSISSGQGNKVSRGVGLGITGIKKHDGGGEFDGVGLVSLRRWIPRSPRISHEANTYVDPFRLSESLAHDLHDEGDAEISDTFLQEAAMTFIQDPFHIHSLATIPECQSWSELDLDEGETCDSVSVDFRDDFETQASHTVSTLENEAPLGRMKKHFSASTISSELKRTSVSNPVRRMYLGGTRSRSSTWPSHARSRLRQVKSGDEGWGMIN